MILIAIGANLPGRGGQPPLVTCRQAVEALRALPGLRLVAVSPFYRSAPLLPAAAAASQPEYVNAVARLAGVADPAALLARLHAIEAEAGRVRTVPNAARPLDLDIIALNGIIREAPDPVLPHPRAHLRGFVLWPLAEVAPDWVHPRLGVGAAALLGGLPAQEVERL